MNPLKIIAVSDLHGHLPKIPPCDLLLIAGDVCPVWDHSLHTQMQFLAGEFADWVDAVPAEHIVGVAGNHDLIFEQSPDLVPRSLRWHYLKDQAVTIEERKVYGTPWQPVFCDWAFNLVEEELERKWAMIPDDTDILVLHGPPLGFGDRNSAGQQTGSPSLRQRVLEIRPRLTVFGHIHEGRGRWRLEGEGRPAELANVTLLDERYNAVHPPMAFEI